MRKAICPRCGEYANHEYGNTYSCEVCMIVYRWKPVHKDGKITWVPVFQVSESIEKAS